MTDANGATEGPAITLLGNEMLTWSDAEGVVGAFGGLLAPQLLRGFRGERGRVLVAGPTTVPVILEVATHFAATEVLVRSLPDAEALRAALPEAIAVTCGPLDRKVAAGATYDAVVAVAGIDRLHSAEEQAPAAADTLAGLAALVGEGGELFVAVGNAVGVDLLLSLDQSSGHGDAHWPEGTAPDLASPALADVADLLAGHGLVQVERWHCHGPRRAPLVAAAAATFESHRADPVLIRTVAHAYDAVDPAAPAIKDPAATVRELVRAGLGASTAPLSVLHLRRGAAAEEPADELLVTDTAVTYRLVPGSGAADGWTRELLGEAAVVQVAEGLTRDTGALTGPVPGGPTLADAAEAALAGHDVSAAGELVRRYRDWLGPDADAEVPADRVAVVPSLLALTDEGLAVIDGSLLAGAPAPRDVVLARGLLVLAADVLDRGVRHPWSAGASARDLAVSLLAAAGIEAPTTEDGDAPVVAAAIALDARLRPAGTAPDFHRPGGDRVASYAELAELAASAARRAAEADDHVVWLLRRIQRTQRTVRFTRGNLARLEGSAEMRIGRKVLAARTRARAWRDRRRARNEPPVGEWVDPATLPEAPEESDVPQIEQKLLPPGYVPDERIEVVPNED